MWQIEYFDTKEERDKWLAQNEDQIQYDELFVADGYAIEWRKLRIILDY